MTNTKKQIKITKLLRKGTSTRLPEDCDELQEEIQQLEQKLKEKQNELFHLQRNSHKRKTSPVKKKSEVIVRPQKIMLANAVESLKCNMELMAMLTGTEVRSYVVDEHCSVMFHMQHDAKNALKFGLLIDTRAGANVSKSCLPVGFNMDAVMKDFSNVMIPECLGSIRKGLVAYYERQKQFDALKKMLNIEAQLFKVLDGSHIEITFYGQSVLDEEGDEIKLVLVLDYRVYDIRPKVISFRNIDLPHGASETLTERCAIFKKKPLHKAFKEVFISGIGPIEMVKQVGTRPEERQASRRHKRHRPNHHHHHHHDDTFRPEECSDQSDDADHC